MAEEPIPFTPSSPASASAPTADVIPFTPEGASTFPSQPTRPKTANELAADAWHQTTGNVFRKPAPTSLEQHWSEAGPWERLKMIFGKYGYGPHGPEPATPIIGSESAGTKGGLFTIPKAEGTGAGAGIINAANRFTAGMTSPLNVGLMAATGGLSTVEQATAGAVATGIRGLQASAAATFTVQGLKGAGESLQRIQQLRNDPNATPSDFADAATSAALNLSLAATTGKQAADMLPHVISGVRSTSQAVALMPKAEAQSILDSIGGKSPEEIATTLQKHAAATDNMDLVEHLTNSARSFQQAAAMEPKDVKELNQAQQAWDDVKRLMAPQTRDADAAIAAGSLREMAGELAQRTDRAQAALESSSRVLMKMEPDARWSAVDDIEVGRPQANDKLQAFADTAREMMDSRRQELQDMGKMDGFIDDYFPHIWKDPENASKVFRQITAKTPMEGPRSFLKQRTIPTIAEGRALGLEPVSNNPVDLLMLKAREMDRYILAQKWFSEMKEKGLVEMVRAGDRPPEGYIPINDKIATVYGPRQGAVKFSPDVNELTIQPDDVTVLGSRIMGKYYAPEEVATVANNYLSPGLRKSALFRGYMNLSNSLNRFQLGLSAFHLGFTSIDTSISKLALALEYGAEGKPIKAAAKVAQVPTAPITNFLQGNRVLKEWMSPGSQGAEIGQIVDAIRRAGGRAQMDKVYQTTITKNMMNAWEQGKIMSAIWRAPFAAMEQVTRPLMEYIVPRQKMGVAADPMRKELENLPEKATVDQQRAVFGKAWDSVDNRMGQLVYDNLFWNKTIKDLSMATVRAVGWDLGTIREIGGGMVDTLKLAEKLKAKAKGETLTSNEALFTHRMAYTIALPMLTGIIGATYQYLRTGKGPEELRDYFFPKTGEKDPQGRDVRMTLPTYMKDVYHYAHAPWATIEGKVSPFPAAVVQMLNNKDFFGRDIRNADDPLVKQVMDEATYFAKQWQPIGVQQFQQQQSAHVAPAESIGAFVGVTRAPAWVGETDAEQLAAKLAGDKFKSQKAPDMERAQAVKDIMSQLRSKEPDKVADAYARMAQMIEAGTLSPQERRNIIRGTDHTFLENQLGHLDANEAMRVFRVASQAERDTIADAVQLKILRAHLPTPDREELLKEFERLHGQAPE